MVCGTDLWPKFSKYPPEQAEQAEQPRFHGWNMGGTGCHKLKKARKNIARRFRGLKEPYGAPPPFLRQDP